MLLVILGAGASFDSSPLTGPPLPGGIVRRNSVDDGRPPLTRDLFDWNRSQSDFIGRYAMAAAVVARLRRQVMAGGNLEQLLAALQEQEAEYPQRRRQLMAIRFYLREFLFDCSNRWWTAHSATTTYQELVDEINRHSEATGEQVCYVTFNYDTLLDSTFEVQGLRSLHTIDGYIAPGGPLYMKVHGSVNWRRRVADSRVGPNTGSGDVINLYPQDYSPHARDEVLVERDRLAPWCWQVGDLWHLEIPALAIPVENKVSSSFEMPYAHYEQLVMALRRATRVLVIGWRASEPHFADLLVKNNTGLAMPFTLVCGRDASETESNLRALGFVDVTDSRKGFNEFVDEGRLRAFLEEPSWTS